MNIRNKLLFLIIVVLAFAIRSIQISNVPPSLNWDEISHGYTAFSILKTGTDEWGRIPFANFRAYGDYPLPLLMYLTIPFVALLGLTEFALRFPHIILGVGTVISIYFLTYGITKDRNKSLFAMLLASIGPWYVFPSRFVLQSNLSVFLLVVAASFFVFSRRNKLFLSLSALFFGLTLFAYHTTRIFSPVLLVGIMIIYRKEILQSLKRPNIYHWLPFLIILAFFLPLPFILANPESRARSSEVFLVDQGSINRIIENRLNSPLPDSVSRLIYNRPLYFVVEFSKNYIQYFSPQFLFLKGGTQYQFSIPGFGLLFMVNLPFFYLGVFMLVRGAIKGKKLSQSLLVWLLLAPIPASITKEHFAVLRATTMLPITEILTAIGAFYALSYVRKQELKWLAVFVYFFLLTLCVESYYQYYFKEYSIKYSSVWQYGYKEAVGYISKNYDDYDAIIFTKKYGEAHEFVLFHLQWDPAKYKNDANLNRFFQSRWYWVDRFDKFYFVNDWEIPEEGNTFVLESRVENINCTNKKCLLITSPDNFPRQWKLIEQINYLDGNPVFEIYKNGY